LVFAPSGDYSNGGDAKPFQNCGGVSAGHRQSFFLERFKNPAATEKAWAVESRASVLDCGSL
jgi:hypothetical protein